jgi:cytochrome c peroxidase
MLWVPVHEFRSSKTCSRCYSQHGLQQDRHIFKLKKCVHGGDVAAPVRLPAQMHAVVQNGRPVPLVLDRDINAARVLAARGVAQLVPAEYLHPGQLRQLAECVDRGVRRGWLEQQQ